jgi:hypothetical protein
MLSIFSSILEQESPARTDLSRLTSGAPPVHQHPLSGSMAASIFSNNINVSQLH